MSISTVNAYKADHAGSVHSTAYQAREADIKYLCNQLFEDNDDYARMLASVVLNTAHRSRVVNILQAILENIE